MVDGDHGGFSGCEYRHYNQERRRAPGWCTSGRPLPSGSSGAALSRAQASRREAGASADSASTVARSRPAAACHGAAPRPACVPAGPARAAMAAPLRPAAAPSRAVPNSQAGTHQLLDRLHAVQLHDRMGRHATACQPASTGLRVLPLGENSTSGRPAVGGRDLGRQRLAVGRADRDKGIVDHRDDFQHAPGSRQRDGSRLLSSTARTASAAWQVRTTISSPGRRRRSSRRTAGSR